MPSKIITFLFFCIFAYSTLVDAGPTLRQQHKNRKHHDNNHTAGEPEIPATPAPLPAGPPSKPVDYNNIISSSGLTPDTVVEFTQALYQELGADWNQNATELAEKYKDRYTQLDADSAGALSDTLASLVGIRMLELQNYVKKAKKMRAVVNELVTTEKNDAITPLE